MLNVEQMEGRCLLSSAGSSLAPVLAPSRPALPPPTFVRPSPPDVIFQPIPDLPPIVRSPPTIYVNTIILPFTPRPVFGPITPLKPKLPIVISDSLRELYEMEKDQLKFLRTNPSVDALIFLQAIRQAISNFPRP